MESLRDLLIDKGIGYEVASLLTIIAAILVSFLVAWLLRIVAHIPLRSLIEPVGPWQAAVSRFDVKGRTTWVLFVLVVDALVAPILGPWPSIQGFVDKVLDSVLVIVVAASISSFVAARVYFLQSKESAQRLPFKVLGQAVQMVVWTYATVALLSVLSGTNVTTVLTSLTAIGAVLVYVFRDPLLGWTAAVQIAANDLVREGDWITLSKRGVDGMVEDISLTVVKVRNWDKTVISIPTYALISEELRNWRGMYESGGRRIKRAFAIDTGSIRFCDEELLRRLSKSPLMRELEVEAFPDEGNVDPFSDPRPTNLSCFRRWLEAWLEQHPGIHSEMTSMVRELESNGRGIPVEIYVFSSDQRWQSYEKLQAELIDHVLAVLPRFDLRVFQEPTGDDLRSGPAARP